MRYSEEMLTVVAVVFCLVLYVIFVSFTSSYHHARVDNVVNGVQLCKPGVMVDYTDDFVICDVDGERVYVDW